jgi:predicted transcriptional regulator
MRDRLDVLLKRESIEECEFRRNGKGRTLNGYRPTKPTEQ